MAVTTSKLLRWNTDVRRWNPHETMTATSIMARSGATNDWVTCTNTQLGVGATEALTCVRRYARAPDVVRYLVLL